MGNWAIHVEGHGIHDNKIENDADTLLADFVKKLRDAGHVVSSASFHAGSGKRLHAPAGDEPAHYEPLP
jgi:hypothetical protein